MARSDNDSQLTTEVWIVDGGHAERLPDTLAVEAPLEISLARPGGYQPLAVTLRTPGADEELTAGFLYSEGVISNRRDLQELRGSTEVPPSSGDEVPPTSGKVPGSSRNEVPPTSGAGSRCLVRLRDGLDPDLSSLERHFYTSSACGLCGKASLDALLLSRAPELPPGPRISPEVLHSLPAALKKHQGVFRSTGGLHAAGLFTAEGELVQAREDVGRHNALDKLVGWGFLSERLPFHDHVILVSGRASFELVQKCLAAEAPILCAVSAPSSAAVATARQFGLTLVGFLRDGRFNVYSGPARLGLEEP